MNKIKNIMALIAVLVGITSTFAFKNPTSKNLVGTLFAEVPNALWLNVTNANDTTITFTAITDSGDHAYCEISNSNVCDVLA
jgi:hypothetical protein